MGHVISDLIMDMKDVDLVAGVDVAVPEHSAFPVFTSLEDVDVEADVIIDFSAAKAVDAVLDYVDKTGIPLVECTTGLSEDQLTH
jgi:4-hydroxy-tetrahydrodipicolinate reductase